MQKSGLTFDYILSYLYSVRRERTGKLGDFERIWREQNLPISQPEVADLLEILCFLKSPKEILEIGTCVGFSAVLMLQSSSAKITTIERNPIMINQAKDTFEKFGIENRIELIENDAAKALVLLEKEFDFIYLDAAKGQYINYYPEIKRLLSKGGLLVCDNVLFNGFVAAGSPDRHRNKTIVVRLGEFIKKLESDEDMKTVILPISDGVTVSFKL